MHASSIARSTGPHGINGTIGYVGLAFDDVQIVEASQQRQTGGE